MSNSLCHPERPRYVIKSRFGEGLCKSCYETARVKANGYDWRKRNPVLAARAKWRCRIKNEFGITAEQWQEMHDAQRGKCAICKHPEPIVTRRIAIDHDHKTGKVRALLCHMCNRMLGLAREDPKVLRAAADYIEKHR